MKAKGLCCSEAINAKYENLILKGSDGRSLSQSMAKIDHRWNHGKIFVNGFSSVASWYNIPLIGCM